MLNKYLLLISLCSIVWASENEDTMLYYYAIEENERSLPVCKTHQACSVVVQRYWRPAALVRLCRCGRRLRCDTLASADQLIELNNRADFQFCQPITNWSECSYNDASLTVHSSYERLNPDELESMHHKNMQLVPPNITIKCKCRTPNYWKLNTTLENGVQVYQCASLPVCSTGQFCGNVNYDLNALYQSCLCPKYHMCVHNGGITQTQISELLYSGKGWKAYCQRINAEYNYDEY